MRNRNMQSEDWSRQEVEIVVEDYLTMLLAELRGAVVNKAERNRELQRLLPARSRGSIEFKHQNTSAVMIEMGLPYVEGYKPRRNLQNLLREIVERRVYSRPELTAIVAKLVQEPEANPKSVPDILSSLVDPPKPAKKRDALYEDRKTPRPIVRRNYLEIEARNRSLSLAGEKFALEFEHQRLWRAGQKTLAEKIEHVANTRGDGSGFDILSFETDGRERLVEVKTTRFGALTPFFASRHEVEVSDERRDAYHVYRLFDFTKSPRLFLLCGSIRSTCDLETTEFRATVAGGDE